MPGANRREGAAPLRMEYANRPFGNRSVLVNLGLSLRPYQWVKNGVVFGGLIFSRSLFDPTALLLSFAGFAVFCLASSGVYLLNDLRDFRQDRVHPSKRHRPIAAGMLSRKIAWPAAIMFMALAAAAALVLGRPFGIVVILYIAMNAAYSFGLKQVVLLDVMIVAFGFVLRAMAGALVIGVKPSEWLMLCTMMLALLISFGKRRQELTSLEAGARHHRASLDGYSPQLLDLMMAASGAAALVTYALYTMAEETVSRFGTKRLVLTTVFICYGILRYIYLVHKRSLGGDPTRLLVTDPPLLITILLWTLAVCIIIYPKLLLRLFGM